ncbi:MAG TPA: hypothetical protein DCM05_01035 [Elusimicrobia bacterium]|nr:hypothetical protein [Elusimicrobiota bacterium]
MIRLLLAAALLPAAAGPAAAKAPGAAALSAMRRGVASYQGARFDDAVEHLTKALELHPGWKTASGFRAMCRWTVGELGSAAADAKLALGLKPNNAESFVARGFARFVLKQFGPAADDFKKAAEEDSAYALAHFGLGSVFSQREKPKQALPHLDAAVKLAPGAAVIRVVRGAVREKLKDFRGAIEDYDVVVRAAPDFDWARFYRGRCYREIKQFAKASDDLAEFLKRNPDNEDALYLHSNVLFQLGESIAAVKALDRLIRLNPRHGLAYANRGVARSQSGDRTGALSDLAKAKAMLPGKADQIEGQIRRLKESAPLEEESAKDEGPSGVAADALLPGEQIE